MSQHLPNDVVGESVSVCIGPLDAEIEVHSYEHEWSHVSYKPNRVHVTAHSTTSNRTEGVIGELSFTVTESKWKELCGRVDSDSVN